MGLLVDPLASVHFAVMKARQSTADGSCGQHNAHLVWMRMCGRVYVARAWAHKMVYPQDGVLYF